MPHKRQILQIRQRQQNRRDPPHTSRRIISRDLGQRREDAAAQCRLRRDSSQRRTQDGDLCCLRHCDHNKTLTLQYTTGTVTKRMTEQRQEKKKGEAVWVRAEQNSEIPYAIVISQDGRWEIACRGSDRSWPISAPSNWMYMLGFPNVVFVARVVTYIWPNREMCMSRGSCIVDLFGVRVSM